MKIQRAMVTTLDSLSVIDAIEHAGGIWLVPHWLENSATQTMKPLRIIRMDVLPHQRVGMAGASYTVSVPVPTAVLDGQTQSHEGFQFEVIESPDIHIAIPDSKLH